MEIARNRFFVYPDLLLLLLYVLVVAVHIFRINIEATGYTTADSQAYLSLAESLLAGKGLYTLDAEKEEWRFFSIWPIGYPVLIYFVAACTSLPVFWASKLVNFIFLGVNFLVLRRLNRRYAFLLAAVFCSYTLMEMYSFTWSEAPFLAGVLVLTYLISQPVKPENETKHALLLLCTCLFLFLIRYVGAFSFGVVALAALYYLKAGRRVLAFKLAATTGLLILLLLAYLGMNLYFSSYTTGFDRAEGQHETLTEFLYMLAEALFNELLFIRKLRTANDWLFSLTALLQLLAVGTMVYLLRKKVQFGNLLRNSFTASCFSVGGLYLLAIVALRFYSRFDRLDYRFLSPFSMLLLLGLVYGLVQLPEGRKKHLVHLVCGIFFLISLLLNLPKQFLLEEFRKALFSVNSY